MTSPKIIDVWKGRKNDRIPLWLMRQAGRYLPEYRDVRAKAGGFLDLVYHPKLAAEVTLQPLKRFDLDAAIIFSDILVVPQALGQGLSFVEGEGPQLERLDFKTLEMGPAFTETLKPVYAAIEQTREKLPKDKALIGFAGAPFTLASYMIEGGGGHDFSKTKTMIREDRKGFSALIELLTRAVTKHLHAQINAGVDAVQIFDSHAGILQSDDFDIWTIQPTRKIVEALQSRVPVIGFPRGATSADVTRYARHTKINAVSLSHDIDLGDAIALQQKFCVQGNLDPQILVQGGGAMKDAAAQICEALQNGPFVFNLGHGVDKTTNPDHVAALVDIVHGFKHKAAAA